jgi:flagellar biosynthesis protein FlhG
MASSWPTSARSRQAECNEDSGPPERLEGGPRIWAVGGGKGGVGKSVVAASLAAAISGTGRRCAVIDVDLGGANLHTLLGVSRPTRTLSHFLTGEVASLAELMVPTSVPNLCLVSGNEALLDVANPRHGQKEMLFRNIQGLDVDDVLLDLGAGSAFNVLDFFLLARRRLVVTTPEPTAIENAEHFLKAALYRSLQLVTRHHPEVRAAILRLRQERRGWRVRSAGELIALVRALDPLAAKLLEERAHAFAPVLLVNQVRAAEQRRVGPELVAAWRDRLGIPIAFAGSVDVDPSVSAAVAQRQPAFQAFPHCRFSRSIDLLAQGLLREEGDVPRKAAERPRAWTPDDAGSPQRGLPPLDLAQPGAYLRRCREQLGLSLNEMVERTRIRVLDHIESERFELLPTELYLKSYLLTYARELGVVESGWLAAAYLERVPRATVARCAQSSKGG